MYKGILFFLILLFNFSVFAQEEENNSLKILSQPKGAKVYLNSELMGKTPLILNDLEMDNYHLIVALNDSLKEEIYYFYRGGERELFYVLDGDYGMLDILTQPEKAKVFIEDSLMGITPLTDLKAPIGVTKIRIEKEDYETIEQRLVIKKQSYRINRVLTFKYGFVNFPAGNENLNIFIDGEKIERGSGKLETGIHKIDIISPDYHKPVSETVRNKSE